jgi:hypothetical protein
MEGSVTIVDERTMHESEAGPGPAIRPELEHALRREVEQALQPVLADFRRQSVRAARQQVDRALLETGEDGYQEAAPAPDPRREESTSTAWRADREPESADSAVARPAEEHAPAPDRPNGPESASPVVHMVEQFGRQWIKARFEDGRDTLSSEPVRDRARESVDHVLRPIIDTAVDLVPGESTQRALRDEAANTLDEAIKDALEELCSERVLAELQQHAELAFHALMQGHVDTALREIWEALRALFRALLAAVQDQWARFIHLLLDLFLKGAQEMVGTMLKEGLATIAAVPVDEIEEKAETAKETVKDRGQELRERLAGRFEALQERVKEEVGQVKERVAEGLKSAVQEETNGSSFGRPPTGRPPSLRAPSGRPPTGRPPSGRPPSGRPPSMTRRETSRSGKSS